MPLNMKRIRRIILTVFLTIVIILTYIYVKTSYVFPNDLLIIEGKEYTFDFHYPINVGITVDKKGILKVNGNNITDNHRLSLNLPIKIQSEHTGKVSLNFKIFGKIPFKTVTVNVIPETVVVPCGDTVGVKIYTKGILVIGTSPITGIDGKEYTPWRYCDIEEGDIILSANGKLLDNIGSFSNIIAHSNGKAIKLEVQREKDIKHIEITPIKVIEDKEYKLGLWVRDSTSGIGTLTFYDPKNRKYGALGHGIVDVDTNSLLTVSRGDILNSTVVSVKKGQKGNPGELKGIFLSEEFGIGNVLENNEYGIYGKILNMENIPNNSVVPVALRSEIKEGPAAILSNVDGRKIESFSIDIQKVLRQNNQNCKSMVIKVTDRRLINKTGGIVQGMSGSPIIQNGKLVGAVTHVFVNDPTRGYGVFAELMIQSINNIK